MTEFYKSKTLEKMGIKSLLNVSNWSTSLGGSYLEDKVIEAISDVSKVFCNMHELLSKASEIISKLCKVDAAFITSGAGAGIVVSTAACIVHMNSNKTQFLYNRFPRPENWRDEVIVQKGHSLGYDIQFEQGGGKLVYVSPNEIADAINSKTACIAHTNSYHTGIGRRVLPFEKVVKIAKENNIPTIVDSAAILPPVNNLHKFTDLGADLVVFSGGKGIRGPNDTGLVLGGGKRGKELVNLIKNNSYPNYGFGRPFKVSKEQIVGLLKALELFVTKDESEVYSVQMAKAEYIAKELLDIPNVSITVIPNDENYYEAPVSAHVPKVKIELNSELGMTAKELDVEMAKGDPPIVIRPPRISGAYCSNEVRLIDTYFLRGEEEKLVANRLKKVLKK
jgi:L-seryl-tRNA(Ser) seleniumtransferase